LLQEEWYNERHKYGIHALTNFTDLMRAFSQEDAGKIRWRMLMIVLMGNANKWQLINDIRIQVEK
jgi:hypothetical protein